MSNNEADKRAIMEKEIDLIQACINRMAGNSFLIKGWMISLVTVILGLAPQSEDMRVRCVLLLLATVCFWYLDAFYLRLERLYRMKYEWVIQHREETLSNKYDLNPENADMWLDGRKAPPKAWRLMFTKSLLPLYGAVFVTILALLFFMTIPR